MQDSSIIVATSNKAQTTYIMLESLVCVNHALVRGKHVAIVGIAHKPRHVYA